MPGPSLQFLCDCIAAALLQHYGVRQLPVPMREMLETPPPDLARDLGLVEGLPYGDALWVRPPGGQGSVFVNTNISDAERRYAMARAMFVGLCASHGGKAAGLPAVPNHDLPAQRDLFARRLLMPVHLLPAGWEQWPAEALADYCGVPLTVAQAHQHEVAGTGADAETARADAARTLPTRPGIAHV